MSISVEAIFENGVLRPIQALPLKEHDRVKIVIHPEPSLAQRTAGMIPWAGDPKMLEQVACDPEFGFLESP